MYLRLPQEIFIIFSQRVGHKDCARRFDENFQPFVGAQFFRDGVLPESDCAVGCVRLIFAVSRRQPLQGQAQSTFCYAPLVLTNYVVHIQYRSSALPLRYRTGIALPSALAPPMGSWHTLTEVRYHSCCGIQLSSCGQNKKALYISSRTAKLTAHRNVLPDLHIRADM